MKNKMGEQGNIDALLVPVIVLAVLFIGAAAFAVWAFAGRQDYKDNSDAKVAVAVQANTKTVQATDAKQYAEAAKSPIKTFVGPDAYGAVRIGYPKTWSAYIDTSNGSSMPLDAYFHADYVPTVSSNQTYQLRVQLVSQSYSSVVSGFAPRVKLGTVASVPYVLPKVSSVTGTKLSGQIFSSTASAPGTMVVLPLRDKTLKVWTESNDYLPDFTTYILPNLSFSP
jgi:hypothetical protein